MRSLVSVLIAVALVVGCNSERQFQFSPQGSDSRTLGEEPASCNDVGAYLRNLAPTLEQWEPAIDMWIGTDLLTTPPMLTDTTSNGEYLTDLSSTLAMWEDSLEAARDIDFLVTAPPFDSLTTPPDDYLTTVGPLLADWRNAIELWRGQPFLDAPPVFAEDMTVPTILCANDTTVVATTTDGVAVKFLVTATDLCDENPEIVCEPAAGTVFPLGATTVTCTATDADGNSAQCSFTVTVEGMPPTITCPPDTTVACAGQSGTPVEFEVTAEDAAGSPLEVTCDPASGSLFPLGETLVTCSAEDELGSRVECGFMVTVIDTVAPIISCPDDIVVACGTSEGVVVEFEVFASDECDTNVVVTSEPESGSAFPIGTTMVTSTATDGSGNAAECDFAVTVEEATPPEIADVTASHEYLWPPNHKMVDVDVAFAVGDACGDVSCAIDGVTSNEPIDGTGDGNTEPDWEIVGDTRVRLRAERAGGGEGRIYTIHVVCTDELGGTSTGSVDVMVPHDMH